MNRLFTSFPLDPRRIARSRAARVLVWLLALALVAANTAAVAMPPAKVAPPASAHEHCTNADPAGHHAQKPHHGPDCPCCIGKACACVHLCDALVRVVVPASIAPSTRAFRVAPPRDYAVSEARLLRPPIA
ncbi:MAG TPA: hypothetical protein VKB52_03575 [Rhodanobacteraceae bacterium]|nr:hypothetical protein [Rhodanobacteraceae bacterium]